jgi:nucleoside transporter
MEPGPIRARLALMMFGQYLIYGAWAVPLASYLLTPPDRGGLGFTPAETSWIYSGTAIAGLLAPAVLGLLADRLFAAQRLLGVLHLAGAAILLAAAWFCSHQQELLRTADGPTRDFTFAVLMTLMLANAFVVILTLALCNVTGFRNLKQPKRSYGSVRLFGTVGWIVVNVALDLFGEPMSAQPLFVAAAGSLFMGLYSFTLPHTPPARIGKGVAEALGVPALKMFRQPGFRVLILSGLCMAAVQQFFAVYANPYLRDLGVSKPTALQTVAQVSEVICLIAFPFVLARIGFKATLAIGIFGWVIRNALFATGWLPAIAALGLPLHGMCFSFFFLVSNVYVDRHAPTHLRASAQGILTFTVAGVGTLIGNSAAGQVLEINQNATGTEWTWFWITPAVVAGAVFLFFVVMFRDDAHPPVLARTGRESSDSMTRGEASNLPPSAPLSDTESGDRRHRFGSPSPLRGGG